MKKAYWIDDNTRRGPVELNETVALQAGFETPEQAVRYYIKVLQEEITHQNRKLDQLQQLLSEAWTLKLSMEDSDE